MNHICWWWLIICLFAFLGFAFLWLCYLSLKSVALSYEQSKTKELVFDLCMVCLMMEQSKLLVSWNGFWSISLLTIFFLLLHGFVKTCRKTLEWIITIGGLLFQMEILPWKLVTGELNFHLILARRLSTRCKLFNITLPGVMISLKVDMVL